MKRKRTRREFTPLELEIMKVLWKVAPASVTTVRQMLDREPKLAYTTVQTMLNVLERKGKVSRTLKGRAYHYAPSVSRNAAVRAAVHDFTDRLFGGSAESLVMSMIENRQITPGKLARLSQIVARHQEDEHGND
jgi:BlaI family penicillinase repressor